MTLEDLPIPELQAGEVLIKMESVGICGSDVHGFTGESGRRAPGMVMGHEIVGRIEKIAANVTDLEVGQRVTVFNVLSEQAPTEEEGDPSFLNNRVVGVNLGTRGAMAEYMAILLKMPFLHRKKSQSASWLNRWQSPFTASTDSRKNRSSLIKLSSLVQEPSDYAAC